MHEMELQIQRSMMCCCSCPALLEPIQMLGVSLQEFILISTVIMLDSVDIVYLHEYLGNVE